ncbi:MAG: hypothetical protein Q9209_006784 [Squamulea sp. 1 TL-2023]
MYTAGITVTPRIASPLIAIAAGVIAGDYFRSQPDSFRTNDRLVTNQVSSVELEGRNGMSSTFEKSITNAELDAHCLNIELMRQKLRGIGKYQISSKVEGMNKTYNSYFPANVTEEDLNVFLEIATRIRQKVQSAVKVDDVVKVRKQGSEDIDVQQSGKDP